MMNGLGHEERLSKLVPLSQIYLAVTMWTAGLRGPGQLLLEGEGAIDLQRADGEKDSRTEVILNMLNTSGLNAQISSDVFKSIWSKATLNSV
ncbi:2-dehydropantoate 2-reductase N-terminal domain-containing protein, partial [Lactobacillus crispatus]|nr:2-dehydropantoate 2-reductase N-terminal domain-containing protein [Lactobacillus crispatus]